MPKYSIGQEVLLDKRASLRPLGPKDRLLLLYEYEVPTELLDQYTYQAKANIRLKDEKNIEFATEVVILEEVIGTEGKSIPRIIGVVIPNVVPIHEALSISIYLGPITSQTIHDFYSHRGLAWQ